MTDYGIWEEYAKTKSKELRNQIVKEYIGFVSYLAGRVMVQLPTGMDREDLLQYGVFGLIEAIERFDPKQGAKFETYAATRIRGAILDRIREYGKSSGGPSRSVVKKSKEVDAAIKKLEIEMGRHPEAKDVADELGLDIDNYYKVLNQISTTTPVSLDKMVGLDDNLPAVEVIKNDSSISPEDLFLKGENYELLAEAIDTMPEKEKMIIIYYYYEELTLKEIGKLMDLSESRISQLHTQAMSRLRNKILGGD